MRNVRPQFGLLVGLLLTIVTVVSSSARATAVANLAIDQPCIASNGTVQVTFDALIDAWQWGGYAIAISTDATPDASDSWYAVDYNPSCPGNGFATGGGGGANPQTLPQVHNLNTTEPDGNYFLIVIVASGVWIGSCTGGDWAAIPIQIGGCGPPTPTVTPTPFFTLVKSVNVATAYVGDTVTFCINWDNPSASAMTRTFYDELQTHFSFVGADSGCTAAGQFVTCSFPAGPNSSGTKCIWVEVISAP